MKHLPGPLPKQNGICMFGYDLPCFLDNSGHFCGRAATLWCRSPFLSPNDFTSSFNENRVAGCRCDTCRVPWSSGTWYFWDLFWLFWPIQAGFAAKEPLCDVGIHSWALVTLLSQWNICRVPCQSGTWYFWDDLRHYFDNSGYFCVVGQPLYDVLGAPSWALITLLRVVSWK